ncbi:MAG TPA: recombinase family protein [Tepidisphaeraceae bacterium]|jgi:hypothetical protein
MSSLSVSDKHRGKRCIFIVRCSTKGQADTSIEDQLAVLHAFRESNGLVYVDELRLEGLSVSMPRQFIDQLIERKRTRNDFDCIVLQDTSRLTRSGSKHGGKLEWELEAAGIEIIFALENVPEGDFGDVYKSMQYYAARQTAKAISMACTRGGQSALEQKRSAYTRRPPYGIDRLYSAADGTPRYVLRNLPDGAQLKLDPKTGAVIDRFPRNNRNYNHNRKQRDERITVIMGDPECVEIVRRIYRRYYIDGKGQNIIARELNDLGIPGLTGGRWQMGAVMRIIQRPIYTGRSVANFRSTGIYHIRSASAPKPVEHAASQLVGRVKPAQKIRPREDWVQEEEPQLRDFLDPDLRSLAVAKQNEWLDAQAGGYEPKSNKDRHRDYVYLLKKILTSKQGGHLMSGQLRGRKPNYRRHYAISKAFHYPRKEDRVLRKAVLAAPLEKLILNALRLTLLAAPNLKARLKREAEQELKAGKGGVVEAGKLKTQLDDVMTQIGFVIRNVKLVGEDASAERLAELARQRDELQQQIREAEISGQMPVENVDSVVERVVEELRKTGEHMRVCCRASLRRLLELFVAKAEVDLETGHLDLELRLPKSALAAPERLCLDNASSRKMVDEAHQGLLLMQFRVLRLGKKQYLAYSKAA